MKVRINYIFCLCVTLLYLTSSCIDSEKTLEIQAEEEESIMSANTVENPTIIQSEFTESVSSSFAYDKLSPQEQILYTRIKEALFAHEPYIEGGLGYYTTDQIHKVKRFVLIDYPEIFWQSGRGTAWSTDLDGINAITKYEFDYLMNQAQRKEMQIKIDIVVNEFLSGVNPGMSEYEKTLAVYEYLINNTAYNLSARDKNAKGISDDEVDSNQNISSVFIDKKTVCAGYSKATQYLLNKLGIFCAYVSGSARGEGNNHAWNLVMMDGDYYFVDTTWGAPIDEATGEQRISYNYFGLTTEEISKTHTPNDDISLPVCEATKYNYYVYNNLMLTEYDGQAVEKILRDAVANHEKRAYIRFPNLSVAEEARNKLFEDGKDIFIILSNIAADFQYLDDTSIAQSFNSDVNVLFIEFSYK